MATTRRTAEPLVRIIEAMQAEDWSVPKAISELVDNSLGELRGNATDVRIIWDQTRRVLSVIDNGRGMVDVLDSLRLGQSIGSGGTDIGRWGTGGSKAIIWLSTDAEIWTLRDGRRAVVEENWKERQRLGHWTFEIEDVRATPQNTPSALFDLGHGTMIVMKVPARRKVRPQYVQTELARTFGPALRKGRRIVWETLTRREHERVDLASNDRAPTEASDAVVLVNYGDKEMAASLRFWRDQAALPSESGIAIGYGHRIVIPRWDACFAGESEAGHEVYAGRGVMGYLDLHHEWLDFLTLDKSAFNDDELRDALAQALFLELRPLLIESQQEAEFVQLQNLASQLSEGLNGAFQVEVAVEAELKRPEARYHWTVQNTGEKVPPIQVRREGSMEPVAGGSEETERRTASGSVQLVFEQPGRGLMYDVLVKDDRLIVYLDPNHDDVRHARERSTPTKERMLYALIVPAIRTKIIEEPGLRRLLKPSVRHTLEKFGTDFYRASFLDGLLLSGTASS